MVYDRPAGGPTFDENNIPANIAAKGYIYSFLADCRSEEFFVEVLGNPALGLDMLIWDNEEMIFKPSELNVSTLHL